MKIDSEKLKYLSDLSKLDVINDKKMIEELETFISYMEILNNVDTEEVDILLHTSEYGNVLRGDTESEKDSDVLGNSNLKDGEFIIVPKTVWGLKIWVKHTIKF